MASPFIHLTSDPLDLAVLAAPGTEDGTAGASASFTGHVRGRQDLTALELQHHPAMTAPALERIGHHAMTRFSLHSLIIAHRFGKMNPGEAIVHIVASAPHRRAALESVSFTIDVVKTQAPFWKREWNGQTYSWVEPTPDDHARSAIWLEASL